MDVDRLNVWGESLARVRAAITRHTDCVHPAYVEGLAALGLTSNPPRTRDLNERLRPTGWKTVSVDGYLPSTEYASLVASRIFPVSSRIRRCEHVDLSPEPDMIHDVLGHLPMLFCGEHRDYLRELALCASRAMPNVLDAEYHEAVVRMSSLRASPSPCPVALASAEAEVGRVYGRLLGSASEVTCLRRMYVWSVEFGLFAGREGLVAHGAALMSAPAELERVLGGKAKVEPYSLDALRYENSFCDLLDRYFVARDYTHLLDVLSSYSRRCHPLL